QELKATHSRNARIHGMKCVTKAFIAYVAMQARFALTSAQILSCLDLITDLERLTDLLDNPEEKDEVV
ncbi:hypothetical protein BJ138DRAFT_1021016, partial [Hygrophoropsis aurantiaca]